MILLATILACKQEFHPLTLPTKESISQESTVKCQAPPPIEKNIIGTWHFESTYNTGGMVTKGIITFDQKGNITDPDSLFENKLDLGTVISKTYNPAITSPFPKYPGMLFEVYQTTKKGNQTTYFTLVSNECDKIKLSLFQNEGSKIGFTLVK